MRLEVIFPLLLLQPSGKLRKTRMSIWRIRILGFHHYGRTPLQPYRASMTLLVSLSLPLGNGYTSKVYTTSWTYSVGTKKNSKVFLHNWYTPLMTLTRVDTSGPTNTATETYPKFVYFNLKKIKVFHTLIKKPSTSEKNLGFHPK